MYCLIYIFFRFYLLRFDKKNENLNLGILALYVILCGCWSPYYLHSAQHLTTAVQQSMYVCYIN